MKRILGLDFGERRIGVAVSDPLGITAQGKETLVISSLQDGINQIQGILESDEFEEIVVGFPLNLKGEKGKKAQVVEKFIENLKVHFSLPVHTWDERFTSVAAQRALIEMNDKKSRRSKVKIDEISAIFILQGYLDRKSLNYKPENDNSEF